MSDSTIKCDKCDEEFVDSESFESHKEISHENDSFQFIDSRNAVDEEEFVRRNSTKGYNPNPNAGLYDNKLFREGSAKERTSMLGESKATERQPIDGNDYWSRIYILPTGDGAYARCTICGADVDTLTTDGDWMSDKEMLDHYDDHVSRGQITLYGVLSPYNVERTKTLYGESKATEVTDIQMNRLEDWISPADDYNSTGRMKCDICGKIFESHESEDLMYDHLKNTHETNYYQNTSGSWGGWESKANEVDGYTVIDKDGYETPTWYESDNLSDAKREADRLGGSVLEVPSFGGELGNTIYTAEPNVFRYQKLTYAKELTDIEKRKKRLAMQGDGSGMDGNSYGLDLEEPYSDLDESYAKEDDYKYDFGELSSLAQDKIEDGNISQSEWDGSSEEERKDIESVLHGDESDDDGTMLHGSGWNSGAETEPIESNDYLEARDQAISKALKAPIEVEDDYEKVDYEKEDELSAGFIEEQHTERAEDKNKFLDDIDISLENIDYVYPTKIGEAIGKSYITEAIEGLDEEYEGLEDSDEEEVIELVTERKMGGFSNESIARELHITYGVSPEYALSRVHGIEVTTNDKVANTFFGKKYKDCTESEKDELKMYSGSDY